MKRLIVVGAMVAVFAPGGAVAQGAQSTTQDPCLAQPSLSTCVNDAGALATWALEDVRAIYNENADLPCRVSPLVPDWVCY